MASGCGDGRGKMSGGGDGGGVVVGGDVGRGGPTRTVVRGGVMGTSRGVVGGRGKVAASEEADSNVSKGCQ